MNQFQPAQVEHLPIHKGSASAFEDDIAVAQADAVVIDRIAGWERTIESGAEFAVGKGILLCRLLESLDDPR
jgi:hypothetical protein